MIVPPTVAVTRSMREDLLGQRAHSFWLTGLSGSGKSTLANLLDKRLFEQGFKTFLLDGDAVRGGLNRDLGFNHEDRTENIRRVAEVNRIMLDAGLIVINAFISPYRADRAMVRGLVGADSFSEIYIKAELSVCERRVVKGMYAKARTGELKEFTGISAPYEEPLEPELIVATDHQTIEQCLELFWEYALTRIR
ncbi:MAG: adenylyl-sulfate kinase [Bacteroidota bacterium]